MKKSLSVLFVAAMVLSALPGFSSAQTTTSNVGIQAQLELLKKLNEQIKALQQQAQGVQQQKQEAVGQLLVTLKQGNQGDNVKILQALLAADTDIFPEGQITGFFGPATARAVRRFQKKHGLSQVGFVGPLTRKKLNELLSGMQVTFQANATSTTSGNDDHGEGKKEGKRICVIIPPGHLIAPGWLRKHDGVQPIVPICQNLPPGIINHPGMPTSTTPTSTPTSTPDTIAPVISAIVATPATSSATITWTTNEGADSQIMFGTSTAYGSNTTLDGTLMTAHSQMLTGLTASTAYHFQVKSKDSAGNIATSSDQTFTTQAVVVVDTTAPAISSIAFVAGTSTASVTWLTSESATSKAFYGTANPLDINASSTLSVSTTTLVTSHTLSLTGLTASTTYSVVLDSSDAANNRTTSSQQLFTTLN